MTEYEFGYQVINCEYLRYYLTTDNLSFMVQSCNHAIEMWLQVLDPSACENICTTIKDCKKRCER